MILCCGEALIDMIPSPTAAGPDGFVPHNGGAVFNTAIALGRLGVPAGLLGGLSTDMFGAQLVAELQRSQVRTDHIIWTDRPTTLAFVQLKEGQASYSFFDENSAGRMIAPDDLPQLSADIEALFFGGISLVCEPGADAYLHLAEREAGQRLIMLDPNIRPGFITDEARYRTRLDRMLHCANIVKVSDEDLFWLCGPGDLEETAMAFRAAHDCLLIVTRGGEGATAYVTSGEALHIPVRKAHVVDTIGAGDTFNAGFLASVYEQGFCNKAALPGIQSDPLELAMLFAANVAAVTVSKPGADPPWRDEVIQK